VLLKHNTAFRNLFFGRTLCIFADSVMFFSLLKWVEIQTNSNHAFTFFYVAFYLPITLFALPIGTWINNKTLQKVMYYSIILQIFFLITFLVFSSYLTYYWVYLLLIFISILQLFFIPANQSLLPYLVGNDERARANSLLQLGYTAIKIVGQIFTAFMIKLSVAPITLLFVSALFLLISLIFINNIKPLIKNKSADTNGQWKLMIEGMHYIIKKPQLNSLFTLLALAMFFVSSVDLILVSFLSDILTVGVENLSYIGTSSLCGIATGAFIAPKLYKNTERKWLMIPSLFFLGLTIGSLFFITNWIFILPMFFIQGIALGCFNVTFVTYLQDVIPNENYTRTFSFYNMLSNATALPGLLVTGVLLNKFGVLITILVVSGMLLSVGIFGLFTPKLGKGQGLKMEQKSTDISLP